MLTNTWRVGVRRMGPSSFQWCPATGQGALGTNWGTGSSVWTWGRTSFWGWRSTGTGCPGRWWSLVLWRYSRPTWTRSCVICCRQPCFGRGVGLDDPQRSLPFCDSVILWPLYDSNPCSHCTFSLLLLIGNRTGPWVTKFFRQRCVRSAFFCLLLITVKMLFRKRK